MSNLLTLRLTILYCHIEVHIELQNQIDKVEKEKQELMSKIYIIEF